MILEWHALVIRKIWVRRVIQKIIFINVAADLIKVFI